MRELYVAGIGLWTPGYPSAQAWLEGRRDESATRPASRMLRSRIGRYTSLVTRMAVEAVEQAGAQSGADLSRVPTVFGSAYGEIRIAFEQLDMIEREGVPSPARFKNSVHNTASGHVAIATGNMGFSTAIAAGRVTFAMCLLEAWAWLEMHGGSIIVSVADEPLPDHLAGVGRYDPLGIALQLGPEPPASGNRGRLSALRRRGALPGSTEIPERLAQNPCAGGLPLVAALVQERAGAVPIELGGEGWSVEVHSGARSPS